MDLLFFPGVPPFDVTFDFFVRDEFLQSFLTFLRRSQQSSERDCRAVFDDRLVLLPGTYVLAHPEFDLIGFREGLDLRSGRAFRGRIRRVGRYLFDFVDFHRFVLLRARSGGVLGRKRGTGRSWSRFRSRGGSILANDCCHLKVLDAVV